MKKSQVNLLKKTTLISLCILPQLNFAHSVIAKLQHVDFYLTNGKSNKAMLPESNEFSTSQQKLSSTNYTAYGKGQKIANAKGFGYNKEYTDENSNLVYLRARFYHPATQTFITRDTKTDEWNKYGFTGGNPVMNIDPSGHGIFEIFGEMAQRVENGNQLVEDIKDVFEEIKVMNIEAAKGSNNATEFVNALNNQSYRALNYKRNTMVRSFLKEYRNSYYCFDFRKSRYDFIKGDRLNLHPDSLLFNDIRSSVMPHARDDYNYYLGNRLLSKELLEPDIVYSQDVKVDLDKYFMLPSDNPDVFTYSNTELNAAYVGLNEMQASHFSLDDDFGTEVKINMHLNTIQFYYLTDTLFGATEEASQEYDEFLSYRLVDHRFLRVI
ncbi:RHS repeat-associated core domain-containing protein [Facilibium subflavum]|uniref:RHS repeat-associated core domain-containing protein n=1 Tax=Facilibium subflavum TaxID=2219058 RepID=UPI000E655BC3|nr:RHS repeat-associated core domain-containing protein [Facilibium subflavum]